MNTRESADREAELRELTEIETAAISGGSMFEDLLRLALGALFGKANEKDFHGLR